MSSKHDKDKHKDDDETGSGGQTGSIEYHDFITGNASRRDDNLPPDKLRQLQAAHNISHELRVKKQKDLMAERKNLKEGKISREEYRQEKAAVTNSKFPPHPLLANKAQFSGIDKQESQIPTLSETQTNDENRNELENRYEKKYQPEMGKKFNPKPQYR